MMSRTLKLLTASTAFIAAASAGHAEIVSGTATINTSNTVGGIIVNNNLIVSGGPAIILSSTNAVSNTVQINTGGVVRSTSASILSGLAGNSNVVINNSGTIANIGDGKAIDLTGTASTTTIRNAGSISGSITFGGGSNTLVNTGTTSGAITGGALADTYTFTGANHTGAIALAAGVNTLTVSNSTISGSITGTGTNTFNVSNSTITGSYTGGAGLDKVTLTNTSVSGLLDGGTTGGDGDVLTINGANTFVNNGGIQNFETVNFDANTTLNQGVSGANAINITKTVDAKHAFSTAANGNINNTGLLNLDGVTATTGTYTGTGTLGIGITTSSTAGKLAITSGTLAGQATSVTVNVATTAGFITSGTQYIIVDGAAGTASNTRLLVSSSGVYRFSTAVSNTSDVALTVGRVGTDSVVTGGDNKSVSKVIDNFGSTSNTAIGKIQAAIGAQTTAAGVNNVVESLTPSIDGAGVASVNVTVDTGNQISNRLASVRSTSGVATGDAMASQHMWVQGFGSTVSQDDKGGARGYDANSGGVSIGADTDSLVQGLTTGLAISYGRGSVDSNASSNASTDIDSYIATLYASRVLDNGVFFNGQVAGGYNKYDMTRTVIGVGQANGDTDAFQGSAKVEAGKDYAAGGFTVTPLASLQYTYLSMDKYTETGAGGANLTVDPEALSTVDAGVGGQLAYAIPLTDGGTLKPSVHAKYIYRMGDTEMGTTSSFAAGGAAFNTAGVKGDRSSVNLGAGVLLTTIGGTDLSLNYDADIRSNLVGHTGQLKARWAF